MYERFYVRINMRAIPSIFSRSFGESKIDLSSVELSDEGDSASVTASVLVEYGANLSLGSEPTSPEASSQNRSCLIFGRDELSRRNFNCFNRHFAARSGSSLWASSHRAPAAIGFLARICLIATAVNLFDGPIELGQGARRTISSSDDQGSVVVISSGHQRRISEALGWPTTRPRRLNYRTHRAAEEPC